MGGWVVEWEVHCNHLKEWDKIDFATFAHYFNLHQLTLSGCESCTGSGISFLFNFHIVKNYDGQVPDFNVIAKPCTIKLRQKMQIKRTTARKDKHTRNAMPH